MTSETIHISLTSISSRMKTIHHTLSSLLNQSYQNVIVHLYLSKEPYLLDKGVVELPQAVQDLMQQSEGKLKVHFTRNIGPYRKVLPFLWQNWGCEALVATADDDTIYPSDWLKTLASYYQRFRCCIAFRGHRIVHNEQEFTPYRRWMTSKIVENPSLLILPTGKDGILYNTAFFPESILKLKDALKHAPTADDMWLRWNLALNQIPVFVINTDYTDSLEESDYEDSLYLSYNRAGGNDRVIASLHYYFKNKHGFDLLAGSDMLAP